MKRDKDPFAIRRKIPSPFGRRLQAVREEVLHLTQPEIARMLDVSAQTISNWETGESHPTPNNENRVLRILEQAQRPRRVRLLERI